MAKQHVSFVERHVEKIAVGVAGAVLGTVGFLYLVGDPHSVAVQGKPYGPDHFYEHLDTLVDDTRKAMAGAGSDDYTGDEEELKRVLEKDYPPPLEMAASPVMTNPAAPEPLGEGLPTGGKVRLAAILAPTTPLATSGRATFHLPDPTVEQIGGSPGDDSRTDRSRRTMRSTGRDHHWVALCFAISRSAQREKFRVAGYASEPDRRELIVAEVLAERQERSANGLWGEPVPVASRVILNRGVLIIA